MLGTKKPKCTNRVAKLTPKDGKTHAKRQQNLCQKFYSVLKNFYCKKSNQHIFSNYRHTSQLWAHFLMLSQLLAQFLILSQLWAHFLIISQLLAHFLRFWLTFSNFVTLSQLLAHFLNFWHIFSTFSTFLYSFSAFGILSHTL